MTDSPSFSLRPKLFRERKQDVPGPGAYNPLSQEKAPQWGLGTSNKSAGFGLQGSDIGNPGPGTYGDWKSETGPKYRFGHANVIVDIGTCSSMKEPLNKIIGTLLYRKNVIVIIHAAKKRGIEKALQMAEIAQKRIPGLEQIDEKYFDTFDGINKIQIQLSCTVKLDSDHKGYKQGKNFTYDDNTMDLSDEEEEKIVHEK